MAKRIVYLAYTQSARLPVPELLRVYAKSSYQAAFNWLADIADRHGTKVIAGDGKRAVQVGCESGQIWYLERHEVL